MEHANWSVVCILQNKRFFSLPLAAKTKAAHPYGPNPHRGYSYIGQEKLSKVKDYEKGTRNAAEVYDVKVLVPACLVSRTIVA